MNAFDIVEVVNLFESCEIFDVYQTISYCKAKYFIQDLGRELNER